MRFPRHPGGARCVLRARGVAGTPFFKGRVPPPGGWSRGGGGRADRQGRSSVPATAAEKDASDIVWLLVVIFFENLTLGEQV